MSTQESRQHTISGKRQPDKRQKSTAHHRLTVWPGWRLQGFRLTCESLVCNLLVSLGGELMSEVLVRARSGCFGLSAGLDPQRGASASRFAPDHNKHGILRQNVNKPLCQNQHRPLTRTWLGTPARNHNIHTHANHSRLMTIARANDRIILSCTKTI
jgi:hypothetical protein